MCASLLKPLVGLWVAFVMTVAGVAVAAEPDFRLVTAVKDQNTRLVETLLEEGVDVNTERPDGATALLWAAHWDALDTAAFLLRTGAKVDAGNDQGVTPGTRASSRGCSRTGRASTRRFPRQGKPH